MAVRRDGTQEEAGGYAAATGDLAIARLLAAACRRGAGQRILPKRSVVASMGIGFRRMRPRLGWTRARGGWRALAAATGLLSLGVIAWIAVTMARPTTEPPPCETATFTPPDFKVAPFAFDPEARARELGQAMVDGDYHRAYEMMALEVLLLDSFCDLTVERQWFPAGDDGREFNEIDHIEILGFDPLTNSLDVRLRLVERTQADDDTPASTGYVTVTLLRDGRFSLLTVDEPLTDLGPVTEFPTPPYANPAAFKETEIMVGQAPRALPGTLTVPQGPGPFPAIVLVHGSGYGDRDGTSDATKAFRDLAWGLASQGVAVLRYDKRTLTHALAFARQPDFTLDDELVNDALAALALLRETPRIDPAHIFVLGASLGGFAAPRIAQRDPDLAGLIIVSAPSGTWHEWYIRDAERTLELTDSLGEAFIHRLDTRRRARSTARAALSAGMAPSLDVESRAPSHLDLVEYRPESLARDLPMPLLILHGGVDGQLDVEDTTGWIRSLRGRDDVTFRMYPYHGHMLYDSIEEIAWQEMFGPDPRPRVHVSSSAVGDIAGWIQGRRAQQACVDWQAWFATCHGGPTAEFRGTAFNP